MPTLLVHAKDDPLASFAAADRADRRIPGAELVALESGGHRQLSQSERVQTVIETFLATPTQVGAP